MQERTLGFGRYKNTPIKDIPRGYLRWLLGATQNESLKEYIVDAYFGLPAKPVANMTEVETLEWGPKDQWPES